MVVKAGEKEMPKLPVATAFWTPEPSLETGGGRMDMRAARTIPRSQDSTADQMGDFAACMGIEAVYIDKDTDIRRFRNELKWNEAYYKFH